MYRSDVHSRRMPIFSIHICMGYPGGTPGDISPHITPRVKIFYEANPSVKYFWRVLGYSQEFLPDSLFIRLFLLGRYVFIDLIVLFSSMTNTATIITTWIFYAVQKFHSCGSGEPSYTTRRSIHTVNHLIAKE